jgi:hypothetical protein
MHPYYVVCIPIMLSASTYFSLLAVQTCAVWRRCRRIVLEWNAYIARTSALRHVFVSVKGFYYQAEVDGCSVTWLVPHQLAQVRRTWTVSCWAGGEESVRGVCVCVRACVRACVRVCV